MTVAELLTLLALMPRDDLVVMSKDGEGNSFSPLAEICPARYTAETEGSGNVNDTGREPCVVLWPTN